MLLKNPLKIHPHTMFIEALLTIAKLWKQPKCTQLINGSRKCGIYTQWNVTQP
jgi:methylglyoxal synthase